jgi:hypothetical protein
MGKPWTEEQKQAASARAKARLAAKQQPEPEVKPTPAASVGAAPKARPRNLFSGDTLKLQVFGKGGNDRDPIPGFRLYWFNDVEGGLRVAQARASGWQFVEKEEVALNETEVTPSNNDLGSHVRRWVSQGNDGNAVFAYLMKKPLDLDAEHQAEREQLHDQIQAALTAGTFNMGANERRYTAMNPPIGSPSGLPPISISSKLSR